MITSPAGSVGGGVDCRGEGIGILGSGPTVGVGETGGVDKTQSEGLVLGLVLLASRMRNSSITPA